MKINDFDCPSCGASLKIKEGDKVLTCPYCDSTVIVPDELTSTGDSGWADTAPTIHPTVTINTSAIDTSQAKRSCAVAVIVGVAIFIAGLAAFIMVMVRSQGTGGILSGSSVPVIMEFGGEGLSAGYFEDARALCLDSQGRIYVGEFQGGKVQVFDAQGNYSHQWTFGKSDDIYLDAMDMSMDDRIYMVYDGEIHVHDPQTGEELGQLEHPDGWGFDDVAVCDDGSVVASWYCNRDDIVKFDPEGNVEFILREALSGQSGDSELDTEVGVDGAGNIFAWGSFNESFFKFSPNGRFLNRFGSEGDHPGQFVSPSSFCLDHMGRVWVSDFSDLIVFDNSGTYLATIDPGMTLYDMVMENGYRLYGITYEEKIVVLDLSEEAEEL